ncbi:hypothetical protein D3C75_1087520 [compost metagenome]
MLPYQIRNTAPPQRATASNVGFCASTVARPNTPAATRRASQNTQSAATGKWCSRRRLWARTKAFWVPIAMIRPKATSRPFR